MPYPNNHFPRYPLSLKCFGYSFNPEQDRASKIDLGAGRDPVIRVLREKHLIEYDNM